MVIRYILMNHPDRLRYGYVMGFGSVGRKLCRFIRDLTPTDRSTCNDVNNSNIFIYIIKIKNII